MSDETAKGVWPPVATPFKSDLSIDYDRYLEHSHRLLADGANGLAVMGTTSEANSLDFMERQELLARLVASGVEPQQLLPGTGMPNIGDTVRLTRHAIGLGVRGVLLLPPFYYKTVSDDGLFAYVAEVIKRVGDARLRIYLYNFPQMSGIAWSPALVARLIGAYPKVVVGLKDSSGNVPYVEELLAAHPGFAIFPSSEALLLAALRKGAAGCISASANTHAGLIRKLYDGWRGPDAEKLHEAASKVRRAVQDYPFIPAVKAILAEREGTRDWLHIRPPLEPLDEKASASLLAAVKQAEQ
jgi:4-hydroxy-tetrahydrodipicolinate synthase